MKDGIKHIVGKTIDGIVVREDSRPPQSQVFLVFNDGTYFELFGNIQGSGGIDKGGMQEVLNYIPKESLSLQQYVSDETENKVSGTVVARKCDCCGHHEIGVETSDGSFFAVNPGDKIELNMKS